MKKWEKWVWSPAERGFVSITHNRACECFLKTGFCPFSAAWWWPAEQDGDQQGAWHLPSHQHHCLHLCGHRDLPRDTAQQLRMWHCLPCCRMGQEPGKPPSCSCGKGFLLKESSFRRGQSSPVTWETILLLVLLPGHIWRKPEIKWHRVETWSILRDWHHQQRGLTQSLPEEMIQPHQPLWEGGPPTPSSGLSFWEASRGSDSTGGRLWLPLQAEAGKAISLQAADFTYLKVLISPQCFLTRSQLSSRSLSLPCRLCCASHPNISSQTCPQAWEGTGASKEGLRHCRAKGKQLPHPMKINYRKRQTPSAPPISVVLYFYLPPDWQGEVIKCTKYFQHPSFGGKTVTSSVHSHTMLTKFLPCVPNYSGEPFQSLHLPSSPAAAAGAGPGPSLWLDTPLPITSLEPWSASGSYQGPGRAQVCRTKGFQGRWHIQPHWFVPGCRRGSCPALVTQVDTVLPWRCHTCPASPRHQHGCCHCPANVPHKHGTASPSFWVLKGAWRSQVITAGWSISQEREVREERGKAGLPQLYDYFMASLICGKWGRISAWAKYWAEIYSSVRGSINETVKFQHSAWYLWTQRQK